MHDISDDPTALTRDIQTLRDAILTGETSLKLAFWKIEQINAHLADHYLGLIEEEVEAGKGSAAIIKKLVTLMQMASREEKAKDTNETWRGGADGTDVLAAPKRGQLRRALAEATYVALELKFLPILQEA